MGKLTTHVLDTMHGKPASGMKITLHRLEGEPELIAERETNEDGRCAAPLLDEASIQAGSYELVFYVGDYFRGVDGVSESPFLDLVPVRFAISDASANYHVPLLTSPWSYTTYRGS